MERGPAVNGNRQEAWGGGVVVHTESRPVTPSPVTPEHVFPVLDQTILQHGLDIGRTVFRSIFSKMEEDAFNERYASLPAETVAE